MTATKAEASFGVSDPKGMKRLGLKPEATQDEIDAAITKALDNAASAKKTSEASETAANTRADGLQTQLDGLNESAVLTALNSAVADGRISEAEKPTWESLLRADLENGSKALAAQKTGDALNTKNRLGDMGKRAGEGAPENGVDAMNAAVGAYAKEHGIDTSNELGWSRAWQGAAGEKPELFKRG